MSHPSRFILLVMCTAVLNIVGSQATRPCDSQQYLELGRPGTIRCIFQESFYSVFWYNVSDYVSIDPILRYVDLSKGGPGYESGEFDVYPNGSLIVKNVSLRHEGIFTAFYLHSRLEEPIVSKVKVGVLVKPLTVFPILEQCGNISNRCYSKLDAAFMQCFVHKTRPAVTLSLRVRTVAGDRNVSSNVSITGDGQWYTSRVTTREPFHYSPMLSLLVCNVLSPPGLLTTNESLILAQNENITLSSSRTTSVYFVRNTKMELNCTEDELGFIVWKKAATLEDTEPEILFYSVLIGDQFTETYTDDIATGGAGTLVVPFVRVTHEGLYYCIFGDGERDGVTIYDVSIIVNPVPAHPVIDGCNEQQVCLLSVEHEGTLECTVNEIRPKVKLVWKTYSVSDASYITFKNQHQTVTDNGETFDVTLTSTYSVKDVSNDLLIIECTVVESNQAFINLKTKVELHFTTAKEPTIQVTLPPPSSKFLWIILVVVVLIIMAFAVPVVIGIKKYMGKRGDNLKLRNETPESGERLPMFSTATTKEEDSDQFEFETMLSKESNLQDLERKKTLLINQLREKYKDLYEAVQPIPYIRDRLYCVDKIFVEGGIQLLTRSVGTDDHWENLLSYTDMFNDPRADFIRLILEGEPGFGKSTVTLQIAYDWCNDKSIPKLNDAQILILLRLRQLGGVSSIYKSIKYFLLPQESQLTESDVKDILINSGSVVILLDGYDEYPDQDKASDFMEIISRNMFQQFQVILTTRSSYLPKQYPPLTKRVKLTGFDTKAQEAYIRKAVVGEDNEAVEKIKHRIDENPVLIGLCEVPLFFVMFAHMIHESDTMLNFNSVTSFFQHMIACFHEHMKIKMGDKNVRDYELFENDHSKLDKLAFEGLSGNDQQIVWMREDLRERLGEPFYDAYIRIGILVEEEVLDVEYKRGKGLIERRTEVRFYHKLFCEWYAAHYLSNYASKKVPIKLRNIVKKMNPFDLQYVYRFACGISPSAAGKIITRLKQLEGGDKFAVLCLLEQTGKFDAVKETIGQLCSEGVIISGHDNKLLQRSYMQLLEIAAKNDIPIRLVVLDDCYQSVELITSSITTTSGLTLNSRIPFKQLDINIYNWEMTEDEFIAILKFSSICPSLKFLGFRGSVPPQSFKIDSTLSTLKSRNIQVRFGMFKDDPRYILNLETGRWENDTSGEEPTSEEFEKMRSRFATNVGLKTEDKHKRDVKQIRDTLRKDAEDRQT